MNNLNKFKKYRVQTGNILKVIDRKKRERERTEKRSRNRIYEAKKKKKKYIRESIRNEAKRTVRVGRAQWQIGQRG